MNWRFKALLHHVLSALPFGERLRCFFQRNVTKTLPSDDLLFLDKVSVAKAHLAALEQWLGPSLRESVFYEFGTGWDLVIPLSFYALGVDKQITIDIQHLLKAELVNDTLKKLTSHWESLGCLRKPEHYVAGSRNLGTLKTYYGIEYLAPCNAKRTPFEPASIDVITSTNTLEHVPLQDIRAILRECRRVLKANGVMSFVIDYQDHFAYFDEKISAYNFLRFSDRRWSFYNPRTHFQNRLRHSDYLALFRDSGFEVLYEKVNPGSAVDLESLAKMPIAERFLSYSLNDLAIRSSHVLLRKAQT